MCIPPKKDRAKQKDVPAPKTPPQKTTKDCPAEKHVLLRLEVQRAVAKSATSFWEVQNDNLTIEVKAITAPNSAGVWQELEWNTSGLNPDNNIVEVSRAGPMEMRVAARLPGQPWKYVDIEIYDLTELTCPLPLKLADRDRHWKAYESKVNTTLTATTEINEASVWSLLTWNQAAAANKSDVPLAAAGDKHVTVSLGQTGPKTLAADIHICKWPKLEVEWIGFNSYPVTNDGSTEINKDFDSQWLKSRSDPATNAATASCQAPLCYEQGGSIELSAKFKVTQAPTEQETVKVKGVTTVGSATIEWQGQVDVGPADVEVVLASTSGDKPLPAGVACYDPMEIKWYMTEADNTTWVQIGSTKHLLYVILGAPVAKPYWTLLDISCRAAAGKTSEDTFVPAAFVPFTSHTGDGNGFKRKGDGIAMSYYKQGVTTSGDQTSFRVLHFWNIEPARWHRPMRRVGQPSDPHVRNPWRDKRRPTLVHSRRGQEQRRYETAVPGEELQFCGQRDKGNALPLRREHGVCEAEWRTRPGQDEPPVRFWRPCGGSPWRQDLRSVIRRRPHRDRAGIRVEGHRWTSCDDRQAQLRAIQPDGRNATVHLWSVQPRVCAPRGDGRRDAYRNCRQVRLQRECAV